MHAKLAPSSSHRWLECTASILFVEQKVAEGAIVRDVKSVYADEGTEAHEWASKLLNREIQADDIPDDFRPYVTEYVQICRGLKGKEEWVEQKVPLFYSPGETGTMDFATFTGKALHIRDYKHGAGVPVEAEENTQLAIYAQSFIEDLKSWYGEWPDHTTVTVGIHQPRYHGEESLKVWETTIKDLRDFCDPIQATADRIRAAKSVKELEFKPSAEICRWCPAKVVCPARAQAALEHLPFDASALELFDNLDMPEVTELGLEQLAALARNKKAITSFLENVDEHLLAMALLGKEVPGMKLVMGRAGNWKWKDEKSTVKFLKKHLDPDEIHVTTVVSFAKARDLIKDKEGLKDKKAAALLEPLGTRSSGKQILAPEEDKRDAVTPDVALFDVITDEEETV